MENKITLKQVEKAIEHFNSNEQKRLLQDLPHLLKIKADDIALLKIAKNSFNFWDNPDDSIYDQL